MTWRGFEAGVAHGEGHSEGAPARLQTTFSTKGLSISASIFSTKGLSLSASFLDGSGHNFLANCRQFVQSRGNRPFIIVTPCVSSNGNDPKDAEAVLSIAKEVQSEFSGAPKFFLTGFSAGGHATWQIIFSHPELLAGAAPAAANYIGRGISEVSKAPERTQLPIRGFQGTKDGNIVHLDPQWEAAEKQATAAGYRNVTRTMVPNAGHTPLAREVLDYFSMLISQ